MALEIRPQLSDQAGVSGLSEWHCWQQGLSPSPVRTDKSVPQPLREGLRLCWPREGQEMPFVVGRTRPCANLRCTTPHQAELAPALPGSHKGSEATAWRCSRE